MRDFKEAALLGLLLIEASHEAALAIADELDERGIG